MTMAPLHQAIFVIKTDSRMTAMDIYSRHQREVNSFTVLVKCQICKVTQTSYSYHQYRYLDYHCIHLHLFFYSTNS